MWNRFPTDYPDKGSADSTDKIWSSDWVTNFNITVDEIWTEVFTDRTTSNLAEWTNEYYTEAKVSANSTVVALWNDKADKTNVLELDNTISFTPDADYEPATKKYVDDEIANNVLIIATDTQAWDSTETTVAINPKQLLTTWVIASDNLKASADTEWQTPIWPWVWTYTKYKEILFGNYVDWWTIRIKFDIRNSDNNPNTTMFGRIYKNGSPVWTERTTTSSTYTTYSEDLTFAAWDLIQLYAKSDTSVWWFWYYRNFRIYYDETQTDRNPTVNLDT